MTTSSNQMTPMVIFLGGSSLIQGWGTIAGSLYQGLSSIQVLQINSRSRKLLPTGPMADGIAICPPTGTMLPR